jgi:hypothetical protein
MPPIPLKIMCIHTNASCRWGDRAIDFQSRGFTPFFPLQTSHCLHILYDLFSFITCPNCDAYDLDDV